MKQASHLILTTSPPAATGGKPPGITRLRLRRRLPCRGIRCRPTGKELDTETGLYYFGARYLDPKTARWISGDPAVSEYIPSAPVNDEAKKQNQNLPGMGGVFNVVNLHVYHYAGNNPVKYIDPDGHFLITSSSANQYAKTYPSGLYRIQGMATLLVQQGNTIAPFPINVIKMMHSDYKLQFGNGLDNALQTVSANNESITREITASASHIGNGIYQIDLQVTTVITNPETGDTTVDTVIGDIAYATTGEVGAVVAGGTPSQSKVNSIVNQILEIAEINLRVTE